MGGIYAVLSPTISMLGVSISRSQCSAGVGEREGPRLREYRPLDSLWLLAFELTQPSGTVFRLTSCNLLFPHATLTLQAGPDMARRRK